MKRDSKMMRAENLTNLDFRCNLCGHGILTITKTINTPDRFEKYVMSGGAIKYEPRHWMRCENCDVVAQNIAPAIRDGLDAIADAYYEIDFGPIDLKERQQKILALPEERSDNRTRVARAIRFLKKYCSDRGTTDKTTRVLDFGSGLGVFPIVLAQVAAAEGISLDIHLVETDPRALAVLHEIAGVTLHEGKYEPTVHSGYDAIFLNKVLEHLSNPADWVGILERALVPGGLLYIEVPSDLAVASSETDKELGSLHFNLYNVLSLGYIERVSNMRLICFEHVTDPSGKLTCYGLFKKS